MRNLTEKQKLFCDIYLSCLNKTKAAREAGYRHPNTEAPRLYKTPHIKAYIDERLEEQKEIRTAGQKEILSFLSAVLRGEVKESHTVIIKGEAVEIEKDCKVSDKLKVCEMFCKIYSMYDNNGESNQPKVTIINNLPKNNFTDCNHDLVGDNEDFNESN